MENEKELNTQVNPTSNTAITTLMMLANAGYDKALAILEKMGIDKEKIFHGIDKNDMINRPSDIVRELRYVALNRTIEESGYKTLMDLPCGYTPKAFEFIEKGMHYIGCDLPAVINDFAPIIDSMSSEEQKKQLEFHVVDVTNYESLKAAADKVTGPVCIATEGLTVYLTADEKNLLRKNIRRILAEKGGCWLNADVETREYYMAVYKAVAGDRAYEMLAASSRGFSGQSGMNLQKNASSYFSGQSKEKSGFQKIDYEKIEASYINDGFLCEKIPYYREDFALHLYDSMTPEETEKLKENIKHVNIWKITLNPEYKDETNDENASGEPVGSGLPFAVTSDLNEGIFTVSVQGRVDTITAPELLKQFKEAEGKCTEIKVDVSRMPYVSSAGLRVFMMMYKSLQDKDKFKMTGISRDVREIFETTGFDQFFIKE